MLSSLLWKIFPSGCIQESKIITKYDDTIPIQCEKVEFSWKKIDKKKYKRELRLQLIRDGALESFLFYLWNVKGGFAALVMSGGTLNIKAFVQELFWTSPRRNFPFITTIEWKACKGPFVSMGDI